ncbi:MAG: methionyl-tRNA formyltransferase [Candidatus Omnitrophica bacterium]|nr:methionyl-tRNA formyltransferase [Candidatus Omnitrophota bacterium]
MRIIFFGTSEFALPALEALAASRHSIVAVVTAGDKKRGRGLILSFSPIKIFSQQKNLHLLQPQRLDSPAFLTRLKKELCDLFIVCAYGKILTKQLLSMPKIYAINLHGSLLPKYRGAAPVNWAIINGEKESGVTIIKMNELMDQGEIMLQKKLKINDTDTAISLSEKLAQIGKQTLLEALDLIADKKATFTKQDEGQVSFAPKLKKQDGLINWRAAAQEIDQRIRGLVPWPGAFTYLDKKILKIWQGLALDNQKTQLSPGEILEVNSQKGILVATGQGQLLITELQLAGKNKMPATEFIRGHKLETGKILGE